MSKTQLYAGDRRIAQFCPCGKSNKDGKFAPLKGFKDKGHCFSCGKNFNKDEGTVVMSNSLIRYNRPSNLIKPSYHDLGFHDSIMEDYIYQPNNCNLTKFLMTIFSVDEVYNMVQTRIKLRTVNGNYFDKRFAYHCHLDAVSRF